jgi:uncharacterized protein YodC (DUF2158 family)
MGGEHVFSMTKTDAIKNTCAANATAKEESMKFKVGDVVQLKSGGPTMTVVKLSEENIVVNWFTDRKTLARGIFVSDMLKTFVAK